MGIGFSSNINRKLYHHYCAQNRKKSNRGNLGKSIEKDNIASLLHVGINNTSLNVSTNSFIGTLSNTPSVATRIMSPLSTGKFIVSADSGLSLSTLSKPGGGSES